jgi:hypothetical protein
MGNIEKMLGLQQLVEISLADTLLNLLLCMLTVTTVAWYYKKHSSVLGGKSHVGNVLPLIGLTVFLVITVVKSSLALSLGLVGALSIVRFRTPIKEPEELGFLFLTIAIGLGFGAGFRLVTVTVTLLILSFLRIIQSISNKTAIRGEYTVILKVKTAAYTSVINELQVQFVGMKIDRIESINDIFEIYISASVGQHIDLSKILTIIREIDPDTEMNLVESGVNW